MVLSLENINKNAKIVAEIPSNLYGHRFEYDNKTKRQVGHSELYIKFETSDWLRVCVSQISAFSLFIEKCP